MGWLTNAPACKGAFLELSARDMTILLSSYRSENIRTMIYDACTMAARFTTYLTT
jgi:hypothetical protein